MTVTETIADNAGAAVEKVESTLGISSEPRMFKSSARSGGGSKNDD